MVLQGCKLLEQLGLCERVLGLNWVIDDVSDLEILCTCLKLQQVSVHHDLLSKVVDVRLAACAPPGGRALTLTFFGSAWVPWINWLACFMVTTLMEQSRFILEWRREP